MAQAKEKASELIEKYCKILYGEERYVNLYKPKQCALLAVDEIIDALDKSLITADIEWFKQVKNEIEKL